MPENTDSMARWFAPSVDLEPNKDDTFDGVAEAMSWFDRVVPRGTIYATYRVATERPEIIESLTETHEIGVHVHPREFGHDHDQFAELGADRQRDLLEETRTALADAAGLDETDIVAFRAGRHAANETTLDVLADLGFTVDASVNVRYREYMPADVTGRSTPFEHESGLVELPTTYGEPALFSRVGLRAGPGVTFTATAHELRSDRRLCSGSRALRWLFEATDGVVSMYMHPYDATAHHSDLENSGQAFRDRLTKLLDWSDRTLVTASDVCASVRN
jgi:hypothetical protein